MTNANGTSRDNEERATETLEAELKELSARISADPLRFQQVRDELRRRRETRDEQPTLMELTDEQRRDKEELNAARAYNAVINKVIMMELEQAKLVVEAEILKSQRDEAAARLALLAKTFAAPAPRAPRVPLDRAGALALLGMRFDVNNLDARLRISGYNDDLDIIVEVIIKASS